MILEFLDTDVFNVSLDHCTAFLDPVIDAWDIDLKTFSLEIVLSKRLASTQTMKFQYMETEAPFPPKRSRASRNSCAQSGMSGDATGEEIEFLKNLRFRQRRPSPLYYYRELQSLRDPLHFVGFSAAMMHKRRDAGDDGED